MSLSQFVPELRILRFFFFLKKKVFFFARDEAVFWAPLLSVLGTTSHVHPPSLVGLALRLALRRCQERLAKVPKSHRTDPGCLGFFCTWPHRILGSPATLRIPYRPYANVEQVFVGTLVVQHNPRRVQKLLTHTESDRQESTAGSREGSTPCIHHPGGAACVARDISARCRPTRNLPDGENWSAASMGPAPEPLLCSRYLIPGPRRERSGKTSTPTHIAQAGQLP